MAIQAVFLFGPAGSGKGTQGDIILGRNPGMIRIEMGDIIRKYVAEHKFGECSQDEWKLAEAIKTNIDLGKAVDFAQWKELWWNSIRPQLIEGGSYLFDGFFRGHEQSVLVAQTMHEIGAKVTIVWIHISLETAIARLTNRARADDLNQNVIVTRYNTQYNTQFASCLQAVQEHCVATIHMFDGNIWPNELARKISEII
jgi:adenylate kinase family enzyme